MALAIPLLSLPVPIQSDSLHIQIQPTGAYLSFDLVKLNIIVPKRRPDFDKEVLAPLRLAQAAAAEKARIAKAFKDDCGIRGGRVESGSCVLPPPPVPVAVQPTVSVPASAEAMKAIIIAAAAAHGLDANMMLRIAKCESTFNPNARNPNYTAIANGVSYGNPVGMFQHVEGYWAARAVKYGYPGASVFDPVANANVTAAMMAAEGTSAWECK